MFQRFTDRARKVMQLAVQEAERFNHDYVGTEHIFMALTREEYGVATNVFKNLGVDLHKARLELEKLMEAGPEEVQTVSLKALTARAKEAIRHANEESRKLKCEYVGTEHLLLGLMCQKHNTGATVLRHLGVNLKKVRKEVNNLFG